MQDTGSKPFIGNRRINKHDPRRASDSGFNMGKDWLTADISLNDENKSKSPTQPSGATYQGKVNSKTSNFNNDRPVYKAKGGYNTARRSSGTYTGSGFNRNPGNYNSSGNSNISSGNSSSNGNVGSSNRSGSYDRRPGSSTGTGGFGRSGSGFRGSSSSSRGYGSRPSSFGGRGGSFSSHGGRIRGFGNNGSRMGRGNRFSGEYISEDKFIKKAVMTADCKPYIHSFVYSALEVNPALKSNISRKGYEIPTPIQDQTIPLIMSGKDVVGVANTGTGKTAAFLVPLIEKIYNDRTHKALIIVPTRELAEQINEELFSLTRNLRMYSVRCIGGNGIGGQIRSIKVGFNFIIGTPGRLKDLMDRRVLNMNVFKTIVLDEVDRMLDMGFVDEIKNILSLLPVEKQSLFFSATVDKKVDALIKTIIKPDFHKVSVVQGTTSQNVNQNVLYFKDFEDKLNKLTELITNKEHDKVLIFANTKREVDKLDKFLYQKKITVDSIHGDKRQNIRKRAIDNFKSGHTKVLIATDVAARGLDIPMVSLVVNFDIPNNFQDYIHRIGRTGRANEFGDALTFVRKII